MDVEAEIRDLQRRVGELEGSYGFLSGQVRGVHRDLLNFQAATERRFDGIDQRFDRIEGEVRSLREDLPGIVGAAVREVLSERKG